MGGTNPARNRQKSGGKWRKMAENGKKDGGKLASLCHCRTDFFSAGRRLMMLMLKHYQGIATSAVVSVQRERTPLRCDPNVKVRTGWQDSL